jgi:hypothetical protein
MQFYPTESCETFDTQDTLRDEVKLKHVVNMDLSQGDEIVSPQRQRTPYLAAPLNMSESRICSLSSNTDGGFDSLNATDGAFEVKHHADGLAGRDSLAKVDYPADALAGRDSLALDILPRHELKVTPIPLWDKLPIPRSSSRTMEYEKYGTKRRRRLAFLIAACLIVVMVMACSLGLIFWGRKERGHDFNTDQAYSAEDTGTTAPSDHDVSFVAPTAPPMITAAPVGAPTAPPAPMITAAPVRAPTAPPSTFVPDYFLDTTLAFQVLAPKVENPNLLLLPDAVQGKAMQMIVDEQSTYNWTPFRIVQRYALMVLYLSSGGDTWNWKLGWRGFIDDECEWHGINTCRMQPHGELAVGTMELSTFADVKECLRIVWTMYRCMLTCAILFYIFVDANNMVGSIPSEICLLDLIEKIDLSGNAFQGELPACIASMLYLNRFDTDNNQLSGSLPTGQWPVLESLTLSNNEFSGDLSSVSPMPFLRNLDVHNNKFTGGLPEGLFLRFVEELDFSQNQLSGSLDVLFVELNGHGTLVAASTLHVLRLHDNLFQGQVAGQLFFFLDQLQELTMHGNLLTGSLAGECERALQILTADCVHVSCACCTACPEEN